jgi:hypothetical protein
MTMSQSTCEFASASDWWNLTPAPSGATLEEVLLGSAVVPDLGGIDKVTHSNVGDWI